MTTTTDSSALVPTGIGPSVRSGDLSSEVAGSATLLSTCWEILLNAELCMPAHDKSVSEVVNYGVVFL